LVPEHYLTIVLRLLLFYLAVVLFFYLVQDRILYQAARFPAGRAAERAARLGLRPFPGDIPGHRGYLAEPSPPDSARGTYVVFHGNAGAALDRIYYAEALGRLGYRVVLAEYPGYGCRAGSAGERAFTADAVALLDEVRARFGAPVFLAGESLGAAVGAALAAARPGGVDGVALITPWDSLARLAQAKYPFLPARLLVKSKYDNRANLAAFGGPKMVLYAEGDEVVPPKHSRRLFESLGEPKKLIVFEGRGHNTWPASPEEGWWREMVEFLNKNGDNR
jgi:pimeloyl-ACP methyl ester carboxylesterase